MIPEKHALAHEYTNVVRTPLPAAAKSIATRIPKKALIYSSEFKHAFRVIRALRDEVTEVYPVRKSPDGWVIKCLIANVFEEHHLALEWNERIASILETIRDKSNPKKSNFSFLEMNMRSPLFETTGQSFTLADTHFFFTLAAARYKKSKARTFI